MRLVLMSQEVPFIISILRCRVEKTSPAVILVHSRGMYLIKRQQLLSCSYITTTAQYDSQLQRTQTEFYPAICKQNILHPVKNPIGFFVAHVSVFVPILVKVLKLPKSCTLSPQWSNQQLTIVLPLFIYV